MANGRNKARKGDSGRDSGGFIAPCPGACLIALLTPVYRILRVLCFSSLHASSWGTTTGDCLRLVPILANVAGKALT